MVGYRNLSIVTGLGNDTTFSSESHSRMSLLSRESEAWWRRAAKSRVEPTLVHLYDGALIGQYTLRGLEVTVGREATSGLVLLSSRASRHHARFSYRRGAWVIVDADSRHGIWLGPVRVHSVSLREGDFLQLGDDILTYTLLR